MKDLSCRAAALGRARTRCEHRAPWHPHCVPAHPQRPADERRPTGRGWLARVWAWCVSAYGPHRYPVRASPPVHEQEQPRGLSESEHRGAVDCKRRAMSTAAQWRKLQDTAANLKTSIKLPCFLTHAHVRQRNGICQIVCCVGLVRYRTSARLACLSRAGSATQPTFSRKASETGSTEPIKLRSRAQSSLRGSRSCI